ncbi:DUF4890 domain-containing protein [Anditalea andensis]|uniref:DUF4890 domain-containing protein n=1 Tax=Anditalea andensis TaxID=1048983 RepID=A0A074KZ63_9BACT|nr:DUF4890 domain-containing protein [Anditalea andensis]KEO73505.1 hypothetical protein EL17_11405 [Anditalea andensis]
MKNLIMSAAIFAVVSFNTDAQQRNRGKDKVSPEQRAEMRAERLSDQLDLTEEQKSQIYEIHLERAKTMEEKRDRQREEMKERRAAMDLVRKEQQEEVENVLTLEQRQKWQEIRNEDRERMQKYRDARGSQHKMKDQNDKNIKGGQKLKRNRSNNL